MEIGIKTKWLFASELENGKKIVGEFTGTNKVKTRKGEMEAAIFISEGGIEYQIAPFNLVCDKTFKVESQRAELSAEGKNIIVKLLE